jgi:hypothetical protein
MSSFCHLLNFQVKLFKIFRMNFLKLLRFDVLEDHLDIGIFGIDLVIGEAGVNEQSFDELSVMGAKGRVRIEAKCEVH